MYPAPPVMARPPRPRLECRGLRWEEIADYLRFARETWGKKSPQAMESRLQWLYQHNPLTRGIDQDLIVAVSNGRIVGSHHRMRLPWILGGEKVVVPSFHDLALTSEHR